MIQTQIEKDENVRCFFQKGLPELKHQEFAENVKNVSDYTWVHFEGRPNIDEIKKMLEFIHGDCENSNMTSVVEYRFRVYNTWQIFA